MKKLQVHLWLLSIFMTCVLHANNGKVSFAYPVKGIVIDGNFKDWGNLPMITIADGRSKGVSNMDFTAKFGVGYNSMEGALYFIVEVTDNEYVTDTAKPWYQSDNLVLYINPLHAEHAATASMMVLGEHGVYIEQPDVSHQFLKKNNITWKLKKDGNKRYYEGKIIVEKGIKAFRSIGFDVMVVDADREDTTSYVNWGKGQLKQYRSGQLGDVVLLKKENTSFGTLKGKIQWKQDIPDPTPTVVKIKSVKHSELWVNTEVDTSGTFSIRLPVGKYTIQSAFKIASPTADNGDDNQSRIDDAYKIEVSIHQGKISDIGTFKIPTYKAPHYLYEDKGVLHDFDTSKRYKIDNFITTICTYYNIPGASVALIKDGKVAYYNHFGVENLVTQNPVDESMVFQAASVTKSVFGFIVLRLVEKGMIDLDKPLYQYLEFPNIAHNKEYKLLTARIVLSHRSGLPNWAWGGPGGYASGQKADLLFTPGVKYKYSGEAFTYLGRVVEKVSGKNLNQLLKEEVIEALDIPEIYFNDDGKIQQVRGHYADGLPTYYGLPGRPGVAHSLLTEAKAFGEFVAALANKKGLSKETYALLEKRLAYTSKFDSPDNLYWNVGTSLGFFVQDTPFGKAIMHGGNNGNFQAEFVLYTDKKMGFVVFTNSNAGHKLGQELGKYLMYGNYNSKK